ncbi:type VII secretion integral membrane protein EccD [Mycolicibacterium wolinskyi]|nr:type VII secretion integral membrane protein EccD [Mycolicibacterium wolinskyi]
MPDALRFVSIHCGFVVAGREGPVTIDLVLPAALTVNELMPSIVDAVGAPGGKPRSWQLSLIAGRTLDDSMTLVQNGVDDGDLLMLAAVAVEPPRLRALTAALAADGPGPETPQGLRSAGCLLACLLGMVAVVCAGLGTQGWSRVVAAAALAVIVTAAALAGQRIGFGRRTVATLSVAAVAQAAVLGFLVVPDGPDAANFFLAAVAAGCVGVALLRVSDCGTDVLLAVVTVAALIGLATAPAVVWPLSASAVGAVLSAVAMGALSLTPRLSIALAGLTPPIPGDETDGTETHGDTGISTDALAERGRRALVGLVTGCSAAAALGTLLVAVDSRHAVTPAALALAAAVGVALLLRSRSHASGRCRNMLTISGFCSLTAMFALVVVWSPGYGSWTGAAAVAVGLAVLSPAAVTSPAAIRVVDAVEYIALAAVAPLACWLTGIADAVRGLGPL